MTDNEVMDMKLLEEAVIKYLAGVILTGVLLFAPAGTLTWLNGWALMAALFVPMFIAGIVMFIKAPDLLRNRLRSKEAHGEQRGVIAVSGLMFVSAFVVAGLNYRFRWIVIPDAVSVAAVIVFLLAYCMFGEVLRENAYLSRVIEVQKGQKVIDTGLYGIIRHPMYTATVFLFLSMPLILGSLPSFIIMLIYIPLIAARIKNEEAVLEAELEGYAEYREKVRYRLIPYIW